MNSVIDDDAYPAPTNAAATFVPSFPKGLLRNLTIDLALPWIAVQLLPQLLGVSGLGALALAALFPAASVLVHWRRRWRADVIGVTVLVTLLCGIALALVTQDIRFALLKPAIGAALFGLVCLATLPRKAPLMFFFARQFTAGNDAAKYAAWTARLESAGFRRGMRVLTTVWGLAALAKAALWTGIVLYLPPSAAMVAGPLLGVGAFAALMVWTIAFARRGAARIDASNGAIP